MDFGETPWGRNGAQRLLLFIRATRTTLSEVVISGRDLQGRQLFHPQLIPSMRAAWKEIDSHFNELESAVRKLNTQQLQQHGFIGKLLDFKLKVAGWSWMRFADFGGGRLLKKSLGAIDNVLESLIEATGVGSAIKELKDAVMGSIDDD